MPRARIYYAVKANAHKKIVELLHQQGCGFEVSSLKELKLVLDCGVSPARIISSNPLKSTSFIQEAHQAGIDFFAFDSAEEIRKLAKFAPGSKLYLRLAVPNEDSDWPLEGKFGVEIEQGATLLLEAAQHHLTPLGITFHVGSQCHSQSAWTNAIQKCSQVQQRVSEHGLELRMINVGGGFPIRHSGSVPSIAQIGKTIEEAISRYFPGDIEIMAEPGRSLVGEAGMMVTSVIAKAQRNGTNWLYCDVGVFNGLMETLGGIRYTITADKEGTPKKWALAGPSCDGMDVVSDEVDLPELEIGDKVFIFPAGAYTTAYASQFNGITIPRVYLA